MDEQTLGIIGILLFIIVIFVLPIIFIVRHKAKIKRVWSELAEENGLNLELGRWPYLKGELDNRYFEMGSSIGRTLSGRASSKRVNEFYISADVKGNVPEGLIAGKRGMLQTAGPVQTDNEEFNKKIWVDCPNHEATKKYLTIERQNALLTLSKYEGVLKGKEDGKSAFVFNSRTGYKVKKEWLEEIKQAFLDAAAKFDL